MWEDLYPGGWLNEWQPPARVVFDIYKKKDVEFRDVVFDQFEARCKDAIKKIGKKKQRSVEEQAWMEHDRRLHPRQAKNQRGKFVFDMHEAKELLRKDVAKKKHKKMTPKELWKSKKAYQDFDLDVFRQRIYQEIRRTKYYNYLAHKSTKNRKKFAQKNNLPSII